MNKAELVDAMASEAKITKADASRALEAFMVVTSKTLKKGERVALIGFGTFTVASVLPAMVVTHKQASRLKSLLNVWLNSRQALNYLQK